MNERIKELDLHALTYVTHNPKANKLNSGDMFDEKFAELIVEECVGILEPKSRYMGEGPEVLKDKISQIKQHFGVEE